MPHGEDVATPPRIDSKQLVEKIGESIRTYVEQASEEERQRCTAQLSEWCATREREGREEHASRVARGEPAPSVYTPPNARAAPGSQTSGKTSGSSDNKPSPPRPTKARTPSPPRRRRETKDRQQQPASNRGMQHRIASLAAWISRQTDAMPPWAAQECSRRRIAGMSLSNDCQDAPCTRTSADHPGSSQQAKRGRPRADYTLHSDQQSLSKGHNLPAAALTPLNIPGPLAPRLAPRMQSDHRNPQP